MSISPTVKTEVAWCFSYRNREEIPITNIICTYSSSYGKGAIYKYQSRWIKNAKLQSINNLELLAVKFAIKSFFRE